MGILKQLSREADCLRAQREIRGSLAKAQKMRKNIRVNPSINKILPKTDCISMIGDTHCNTPEVDIKSQDILPPKGTFFSCQMRNSAIVIFLPNEADPLNFLLLVEFIKLF
jgi:hypothetical protein